uniref:Putative secreted protein n=1 Tax=Amblyomma americanum TaxID=6943 RepID=A0A0C9RY22_AMBAM
MASPPHPRKLAFTVGLLSAALELVLAQVSERPNCSPQSLSRCYEDYRAQLWGSGRQPGNDGYAGICRSIKMKSLCHRTISSCPEAVKANFSRQERGYEALRDIVCDEQAFQDYREAKSCQDGAKLQTCEDEQVPPFLPENPAQEMDDYGCRLFQAATTCYDEAFRSDCSMSLKSAKAAFTKGQSAVLMLTGCNSSASLFVAHQHLLLAVVTLVLLRSTSCG